LPSAPGRLLRPLSPVVIGLVALAGLSGCGLSLDHRMREMSAASNHEVCYALSDPRRNTVGQGWAVRAQAAQIVARERNLNCDYGALARIHASEAPARDAAARRNIEMIQGGMRMLQPPPAPATATCTSFGNTAHCVAQ
jgi:hypothetical protein